MPIARDRIGPIKKPRRPNRPANASAPVTPPTFPMTNNHAAPMFNPTADISGGRVRQAPALSHPARPQSPDGISYVSNQADVPSIALSAVAALQARQQTRAPLTPNQYVAREQGNANLPMFSMQQFAREQSSEYPTLTNSRLASENTAPVDSPSAEGRAPYSGYAESMKGQYLQGNEATSVRTYNPGEDRSQIDTTSADGIKKMIARRLSRRGGAGIVDPISPIAGYEIGPGYDSDFGPRIHPVHGRASNHTGDDISMPGGTPVLAPVGGVVSSSAATGGAYGNQVIMDHGAGQQTMFGHLQQLAVPPGTKVKKGEVIGYVGSTGLSTGNHLHHESWVNGEPIDPARAYGESFNQEQVSRLISERALRYAQNHPETLTPVADVQPEVEANTDARDAFNSRAFKHMPQVGDRTSTGQKMPQAGQLAQNPQLNALMQAIREQESGGDYSVLGVPTKGDQAHGAFQIMGDNINGPGGWDAEALGKEITGQEFLNSPQLQNNIAKFKLKDYFKKYGAAGAAKAWYAGESNANLNSNGPQYGGPSVNAYSDSVLNLMRKYMPNSG